MLGGFIPPPPPPPIVLLSYNKHSSIPISDPQSRLAFRYFIQRSIPPFLSALLFLNGHCSIPSSTSIRSTSISFQTHHRPPLSVMDYMDVLPHWIGTPSHGYAPLNLIPPSLITIITPLAHSTLHIRHTSFPGGTPLFPANSSYCLSNPNLILHELTSPFEPFRYHKSSQTTLESNLAHLPRPNCSKIQGAPPVSLRHCRIMCSCICWPWWDGRFSGWHCDYVWLISFNYLVGLLFLVPCIHFWITHHFLCFSLM